MCIFNQRGIIFAALAILYLPVQTAQGTWSIVIANRSTHEAVAGQATCLNNRNLLTGLAAVRVDTGIGLVQNSGDSDGIRRQAIVDGFIAGLSPQQILALLSEIKGHNGRQYGICNVMDEAASFSGNGGRNWNGGRTGIAGADGQIVYAIQGNTLAGPCVVEMAEAAILSAVANAAMLDVPVDMPEAVMSAMDEARKAGGDGRCSCSKGPQSCGCGVMTLDFKSAHVGYVIGTRTGDINDDVCNAAGCADGTYFMNFNVATNDSSSPDPVDDIREQFDLWRRGLHDWPDAVQSQVRPVAIVGGYALTIELKDWRGLNIPADSNLNLTIEIESGNSDVFLIVGPTPTVDPWRYTAQITGVSAGTERIIITASHMTSAQPTVVLMPVPELMNGTDADDDGHFAPPIGGDCNDSDRNVNPDAEEDCFDTIDNDCDALIDAEDPDCAMPPVCTPKNGACAVNGDCCSGKCRRGKCVGGPSTAGLLFETDQSDLVLLAANSMSPAACSVPVTTLQY